MTVALLFVNIRSRYKGNQIFGNDFLVGMDFSYKLVDCLLLGKVETMTKEKQAWVVQVTDPTQVETLQREKAIAISWPQLNDLSKYVDRRKLRDHYLSQIRNQSAREVAVYVNQLHLFVNEMGIGDFVVAKIIPNNEILIGTIVGRYEYRNSLGDKEYPHMRLVDWRQTVDIARISNEFAEALQTPSDIFSINGHKSEIENLLAQVSDNGVKYDLKTLGRALGIAVAIVAILGGTLQLPALFVSFMETIFPNKVNPADHLIIQNAHLNGTVVDFWLLDQEPWVLDNWDFSRPPPSTQCMEPLKDHCTAFFYFDEGNFVASEKILMTIGNAVKEPLVIEGIAVTLLDYQDLGPGPIDVFYWLMERGGGGYYNPFELVDFPLTTTRSESGQPIFFETADPQASIGRTVLSPLSCEDSRNDCFDFLYLADENDVEGVELRMPFLSTLPPGWYSFEVRVRYSYRGETFDSSDTFDFNVIKPTEVQLWTNNYFTHSLAMFPVILDFEGRTYGTQVFDLAQNLNPPGVLALHIDYGLDDTFFLLNLQSGEIQAFDRFGAYSNFYWGSPTKMSPSRLMQVGEIHINGRPSDLALIDLEKFEQYKLTNSPSTRELHPSWSPSGDKIAFVRYAVEDTLELKRGESDIYVYDLRQNEFNRVTFNSALVEVNPVWVGAQSLAFVLPLNVDRYNVDEGRRNAQTGIGLVSLETGESQIISNVQIADFSSLEFRYLHASRSLVVIEDHDRKLTIYDLNGNVLKRGNQDRDCLILDSNPIRQVCLKNSNITVVDLTTGEEELLLELADSSAIARTQRHGPGRKPLVMVDVKPDGFAILDTANGSIYQYTEDVQLVQIWEVPQLAELTAWPIREIVLVSHNLP